jgi:hypothetical protein
VTTASLSERADTDSFLQSKGQRKQDFNIEMSCLQNQTYFGDGEEISRRIYFAGAFILLADLFCRRSYFAGAVISPAHR